MTTKLEWCVMSAFGIMGSLIFKETVITCSLRIPRSSDLNLFVFYLWDALFASLDNLIFEEKLLIFKDELHCALRNIIRIS